VLEIALERKPEPLPDMAQAAPLPSTEEKPATAAAVKH
jgi:hypothetical protein